MRPFIITCCLLLALQLYVSPSQANSASEIFDPDKLVSQLRASADNKVTVKVTSQQLRSCNANTLCKDTVFSVCEFGGGRCHTESQSRTVNNKYQHTCTIRVSNCEEKPAHPKKSYEQVLEELRETGVSNFYEPNPDNCNLYCEDQFWEDIRAYGNCERQYLSNKICSVFFQLQSKWPEVPLDLSEGEIFRRAQQVNGVKIKKSSQEECVKSCKHYQGMCSKDGGARSQCGTQVYSSTYILCHIQIQCFPSRHNRVDLRRRN